MTHTYMPIQSRSAVVAMVPWEIFTPEDETWAQKNHDQSLAVLAGRSGLGICELVAILDHRPWRAMKLHEGWRRLWEISTERGTQFNSLT